MKNQPPTSGKCWKGLGASLDPFLPFIPMIIREASHSDLSNLLGLYNDLHSEDDELPDETVLNRVWTEMLDAPRHHVIVGEVDGELVSSCILQTIPNLTRGARPYGLIENVVTRQAKRRQGYAGKLLEYALRIAWQEGCYKVMLLTGRTDESVFRVYEKAGFKRGIKTGLIAKPPKR